MKCSVCIRLILMDSVDDSVAIREARSAITIFNGNTLCDYHLLTIRQAAENKPTKV